MDETGAMKPFRKRWGWKVQRSRTFKTT